MGHLQKLMSCGHGISPNKETEGRKGNVVTPAHWGAAESEEYWVQCSCSTALSEGKNPPLVPKSTFHSLKTFQEIPETATLSQNVCYHGHPIRGYSHMACGSG